MSEYKVLFNDEIEYTEKPIDYISYYVNDELKDGKFGFKYNYVPLCKVMQMILQYDAKELKSMAKEYFGIKEETINK